MQRPRLQNALSDWTVGDGEVSVAVDGASAFPGNGNVVLVWRIRWSTMRSVMVS